MPFISNDAQLQLLERFKRMLLQKLQVHVLLRIVNPEFENISPESCRIQNTSGVKVLVLIYRQLRSRAVTEALGSNLTQRNEHLN